MKVNHTTLLALLALPLLSALCSCEVAKDIDPQYKTIPKVGDVLPEIPTDPAPGTQPTDPTDPAGAPGETACAYWNGLRSSSGDFQLIDNLDLSTGDIKGVLRPKRFAPAMMALSAEYAQSIAGKDKAERLANEKIALDDLNGKIAEVEDRLEQDPNNSNLKNQLKDLKAELAKTVDAFNICNAANDMTGTGSKLIDPPTLDKFMKLAQCEQVSGRLGWLQYQLLQILPRSWKMDKRNQAVVQKAEEKLPGIFTGTAGSLKASPFFADLYTRINGMTIDDKLTSSLGPMTFRVPLFTSNSWSERQKDTIRALKILSHPPTRMGLLEWTCRFSINQRLSAQLLALKGIGGTPVMANDSLGNLPKTDTSLPQENTNGKLYGLVVTPDWIVAQISNPTVRPLGANSTGPMLSSLRYMVSLVSFREDSIYQLSSSSYKNTNDLLNRGQVNPDLLKLSFAYMGAGLGILQRDLLNINGIHVALKSDDTADNFAELLQLNVDLLSGLANLSTANPVDAAALSASQIQSFTDPQTGSLVQLRNLLPAVSLEGRARYRSKNDSLALRNALRRAGRYLGDPRLANLSEDAPAPLN